ncbi:hypothetical protein I533_04900 [Alteromonas mediterranea MED64]|uniref:UDP-4-amino-4, 6-dideoxy-N-acetyl-beta-L-altrosamine N-acetyltransferase n=1 Tax=Alteromonas mediterranea TaxID=314275 RepID=UPI00035553CD|nr:UDP-4-amino-4,6-dideoxy-N-acetyl-beta-L-altrosamine N-acetyltransferase [Alteromonas mediterranea]AGP80964.1 hypothetical protein I533_04900 [Alteromonas mediterranea MED64]
MAPRSPISRFSPLTSNDLEIVLQWRNQPHIRQNMHNQDEITWSQHEAWFDALKNDESRCFFVFYQNDRPIGVLNFSEHQSTPYTLEWGCYIGEDDVWPGSGLLLEIAALEYALNIKDAAILYAEVLAFNKSVIKLHTLFQYTALEDGHAFTRNKERHSVKRFEYKREQWQRNKTKILSRLPKQVSAAANFIKFDL